MSAYGRASWFLKAIGKGKVYEDGNEAIYEGSMFLKTTAKADTFEVLKEMGSEQERSFCLHNITYYDFAYRISCCSICVSPDDIWLATACKLSLPCCSIKGTDYFIAGQS